METNEYSDIDVRSILEGIGYNLTDDGHFFRAKPLYRDSNNPTSLRIHKETGGFVDFSTGQSGTLIKLLSLHGIDSDEKIKQFVGERAEQLEEILSKPKLSFSKFLSFDDIGFCVTNYKYFLSRGISEETQKTFGIKYCTSGKMGGRAVVPIYDLNNEIIAFAGRSVFPDNPMTWKILGPKTEVVFPLHLNLNHILEEEEVILVEGVSDVMALWEEGIKNVICLFGTRMTTSIKNFLISANLKKIIIATNNEPDNEFIGNMAAKRVYNTLSKFICKNRLLINLPPRKDFAICSTDEICTWKKNTKYGYN